MNDQFEQLIARVEAGEISFAHAQELARREIAPVLTAEAVEEALHLTAAYVNRRRYQEALPRLQLIAEALERWDAPEAAEFLWMTRVDELNAAAGSLLDIADPNVFASARKSGEEMLAAARKQGDQKKIALVNRLLGVLHLDPYMLNHLSTAYAMSHQQWLLTAAKKKGANAAFDQQAKLPEPVDALEQAAVYLRAAADGTAEHARGLNLKALAEAMVFRRIAASEESFVTPEIAAVAQEALALIDPDRDPDAAAVAQRIVKLGGGTATVELDPGVVSAVFDEDPRRGLNILLSQASNLEPRRRMQHLIESRQLFDLLGFETERKQRWQLMMHACFEILKETAPGMRGRPFAEALSILEQKTEQPDRAFALLGYAANSGEYNLESEGQLAIRHVAERLDDPEGILNDFLAFLITTLSLGLGSNAVHAEQWVAAVESYSDALRRSIALQLPAMARDCVARILDVTEQGVDDDAVPGAVLGHFGTQVLSIEALDDAGASHALRQIIKRIVTAMAVRGRLKIEWLNISSLVAKGARLARLLASKAQGEPEDLSELLAAVAAAEENAGDEALPDADDYFDELALLSYASITELEAGDTPGERLRNLQRAYDRRYNEDLLRRAGVDVVMFSIDDVQQRLADDAVLLNDYLGATPSGNTAVFSAMYTREGAWLSMTDTGFPDALVNLGAEDGDGRALAHPLVFVVQALRQKIEADPEPGETMSRDAAEDLSGLLPLFFGHLLPQLERLSENGKRVLYVIPHGPLHFLPFHLLGGETPLADRWTVVAVPNFGLVTQEPPRERAPKAIAAVGMSFTGDNRWALTEMEESAAEARAIAEIFGVEPLIDEQATRDAVLSAMGDARYVHISSHGVHNVAAPSFQAIFLAPDETSDGRLFAREVSALDLRHVELVSLSACETALGRFDEADNLRGLPASFLLAGAGAIIGTLWPAEVESSQRFFTTLYSALAAQASIVEAFRTAQQETRKNHPEYRDWGAFYLMRSPVQSAVRPIGD